MQTKRLTERILYKNKQKSYIFCLTERKMRRITHNNNV